MRYALVGCLALAGCVDTLALHNAAAVRTICTKVRIQAKLLADDVEPENPHIEEIIALTRDGEERSVLYAKSVGVEKKKIPPVDLGSTEDDLAFNALTGRAEAKLRRRKQVAEALDKAAEWVFYEFIPWWAYLAAGIAALMWCAREYIKWRDTRKRDLVMVGLVGNSSMSKDDKRALTADTPVQKAYRAEKRKAEKDKKIP